MTAFAPCEWTVETHDATLMLFTPLRDVLIDVTVGHALVTAVVHDDRENSAIWVIPLHGIAEDVIGA